MKTKDYRKIYNKKGIDGAIRYLGYKNIINGYIELRKYKNKIGLFLTVTPLSKDGKKMSYYDMVDDEKNFKKEDYINQFIILFNKKELHKLKDIINEKIKRLS